MCFLSGHYRNCDENVIFYFCIRKKAVALLKLLSKFVYIQSFIWVFVCNICNVLTKFRQ